MALDGQSVSARRALSLSLRLSVLRSLPMLTVLVHGPPPECKPDHYERQAFLDSEISEMFSISGEELGGDIKRDKRRKKGQASSNNNVGD